MQNDTLIHETGRPYPSHVPDGWVLIARYPATHYTRWYDSEVAAMSELRLWADEPHATECEIVDRPAVDITPPGCTRSYVIAMPVSEWLAPARAA